MLFEDFAKRLEILESTSSRNEKTEELAKLLNKLDHTEIKPVLYLIDGRISPRYVSLEFNFSSKLLKTSLESIVGRDEIDQIYKKVGDIGELVERIIEDISNTKSSNLNIKEVFDKLVKIAQLGGKGSQEMKMQGFIKLVRSMEPISAKYLSRMIIGKMRLGLNDKSVLDSISWATVGDKSIRDALDRAYGVRSDLGEIARIALDNYKKLDNLVIETGLPVASKLVEREKSVEALFNRFPHGLYVQPKYDGLRAQIHYDKKGLENSVKFENEQKNMYKNDSQKAAVFSRNMNNMTEMFPDVVQNLDDLGVDSLVIDSEAIGYDEVTGKFVSFQNTISRKRKYDVEEAVAKVPVKIMVFDILFLNGEDVSQKNFEERIAMMKRVVPENHNMFVLSETYHVDEEDILNGKFEKYIEEGLEGLIAKGPSTKYDPGTRNYDWIKLKATIKNDFVDNVDCIVMGYYYGEGYRAKFGIGALLVGIYNKKSGNIESIAKIGTGIKDDLWKTIKLRIDDIQSKNKPAGYVVHKDLEPDVWVNPEVVSEIGYDEITKSKVHSASKTLMKDKALSLRFPRLIIFERDKRVEQATSSEELLKMYRLNK